MRGGLRRWCAFGLATGLIAFCGLARVHDAFGQADIGWIALFDGSNLDNWDEIGNANWRIEDGIVQADNGKEGYLVSKDAYTDFDIRAEFWVDDEANSGIYFRCTDPKNISSKTAYEANIYDKRPDPTYGTGAIVNVAKVVPMPKAGGKWNTYEITAKGAKFSVTLNGQRTVDGAQDTKFPSGLIALQYGSGIVKFRKVLIKPL